MSNVQYNEAKKHVDDVMEKLKGKYKSIFFVPKTLAELQKENRDEINQYFKDCLKIAYPDETATVILKKNNLLRPNVDELYKIMLADVVKRDRNPQYTEAFLKEEFNMTTSEFYYTLFPGRRTDFCQGTRYVKDLVQYFGVPSYEERVTYICNNLNAIYNQMNEGVVFDSVESVMKAVPETDADVFEFYVKITYRESVQEYLKECGVIYNNQYYVYLDLNSLPKKGCLIDIDYETTKTKLRAVLKKYGTSTKRTYSKNVDYVITDRTVSDATTEKTEFVSAAIEHTNKTGKAQLVLADLIFEKEKIALLKRFESATPQEKLKQAIELYDLCVEKVEKAINDGTYNEPICSQDSEIYGVLHKNVKIEDAFEFFDAVAKRNSTWENPLETAKTYKKMYRSIYTKRGCALDGICGVECPIALCVANFVYGSPFNTAEFELARDKWEYRGDYRGSYCFKFILSLFFSEGRVERVKQDAYDM